MILCLLQVWFGKEKAALSPVTNFFLTAQLDWLRNWTTGRVVNLGRNDFNLIIMIFLGELPYDASYQKKHSRPYGRAWGLLLYPAQPPPYWLKTKKCLFFIFLLSIAFICVLNHHQLPIRAFVHHNCVQWTTILIPCTNTILVAENQPKITQKNL